MECLKFDSKSKDGMPNWHKDKQKKIREVFMNRKKKVLATYSGIYSEAFEKEIDHRLREELDYWEEDV